MSLEDLDPLLNAPKRLRLMAILRNSAWAEFAFLQGHVELPKADMSKQMRALIEAGYVESRRAGGRRGGTAWYRATKHGSNAFDDHVAALDRLTREVPISHDEPS